MSKVVNLNRFRKQKERKAAEEQAAQNRARFGRTQEQKLRDAAEAEEAQRRLDLLRRESAPADTEKDTP
ncbi:MAG: DUF4169 family protein [Sinimarinibacterium sp.]|jgi:hypothetical protein